MFHFIDQRLLCNELRAAAHAVLTNATGLHRVGERSVRSILARWFSSRGRTDCGGYAWRSQEGSLGWNPQFKPFLHRRPSSQSLTRLLNWQPFDASLTCLCGQVFLGEGQLGYRQPSEDALSTPK